MERGYLYLRAGSKALYIIAEVLLPMKSIARRDKSSTPLVLYDDVFLVVILFVASMDGTARHAGDELRIFATLCVIIGKRRVAGKGDCETQNH